ncbi:IpaD/SipD/SspD family type III secretion system needle tip protein [Chromobacterium sp. Panama]|uniref:type III secretion system needle tip protein SctA n=1 Tax=Chromobacterium sp. Panama TaxID=2161826 RepID=UPI000D315E66|nr:type III secretion system needle tip protein SctA [Chromobacterium sp. Panama]PTU64804.1 IpaD/SipD/SspD family type III secretion system needle tip protein [Chromobacterium sp. Panama]
MNGIQTTSSLPLTLPQTTETPAAAPRADVAGVAVETRAAAPQGPELPALNTAQNKADALRQANEAARRTVEGQTTYESKLADQRWQAAIAGGEQPVAERLNFQRGALTRAQDQARDMQTLNTQQLKSGLGALAQSGYVMSAEQQSKLQADIADVFADAPPMAREFAAPMLYTAPAPGAAKDMISDRELWDLISESIGNIKDGYLGVYENVVGKYIEFYQEFSDILSQMAGWISSNDKGDKVTLNVGDLYAALKTLKEKYENTELFASTADTPEKAKEEAEKWAAELGLPKECVKEQPKGSGRYVVVIDTGPVDKMMKALEGLAGNKVPSQGQKVEMDNAKFQSWQSGFKAQEENLKNTLQTLTQKYSNANSLFDNLVKVLSSTISSCTETAKSFLQG